MLMAVAFRIDPKQSLPHAIRRIVRAQLEEARAAAINPALPLGERVHEVRTAMKKVRALNRLVRPALGKPARHADRRLRKIAHSASALRDAGVVLKTFDHAAAGGRRASWRAALAGVRARLALHLREQAQAFELDRCARRLRSDLAHERRKVDAWLPKADDWSAIDGGLTHGYRRARQAMAAAYRTESGTDFHAWRRAVKTHRHQIAALEAIAPRRMTARLDALDRLGDLLGDEHDLTVLEAAIGAELADLADPQPVAQLQKRLAARRRGLRRRAQPLGKLLFEDRPSAFRDRARRDFRAARS
jgi:CHAD domain-containing protein